MTRWRWVLLFVFVLAAYGPALRAGFVNWDDPLHVYESPRVIESDGWLRSWRDGSEPGLYPVLFTTYYAEWRLTGGKPWLFHLDNILLHGVNAILVGRFARALGMAAGSAWVVAAVWALHPVQVESVAWITERKNVLYVFFWLVSLLLYLRSRAAGRRARLAYAASLVAYALSILSKAPAITLPGAILLIEWAEGRRLEARFWRRLVPYLLLSVAGGIELLGLVPAHIEPPPLATRLALAIHTFWFYLATFVWPRELVPVYPRWPLSHIGPSEIIPLIGIVALIAVGVLVRNRLPRPILIGAGLFVMNIGLVLGVVWNSYMRFAFVADRYLYLPSIGLSLLVVSALERARFASWPAALRAATVTGCLAALGVATWRQVPVWHDSQTLWAYTLARNPECGPCHTNLAVLLASAGKTEEAASHFELALRDGRNPKAAIGLGNIRMRQGRAEEAAALYTQAAEHEPRNPVPRYNLGNALRGLGKTEEAIAQYRAALVLDPDSATIHNNLGAALLEVGRLDEAKVAFEETLRLNPGDAEAQLNLGLLEYAREEWPKAIEQLEPALLRVPDHPRYAHAHSALAKSLAETGRTEDAIAQYRIAHRQSPDVIEVLDELVALLLDAHQVGEAVRLLEAAIERAPDASGLAASLAWIKATTPAADWRDGAGAVRLAERAIELSEEGDPDLLDTLAAAYAEAGRLVDAKSTARRALAAAPAGSALAHEIRERLALYESGRAYRMP
jgi:tetratricopeptide (TPR) repeat protein